MENIEVMVILFIIVVLGYTLCKLGYMGDRFDQKLSSIVIDITCPALILSSVMGKELPDRTLILPLLGVGFLTYILLLVFGFWVPRLVSKNRDEQGMIGFALMFANVGFIGYPIVSSIFGPKSIFYAALLNMPNTFFIFTAGVMLVKGEYSIKSLNPKVLFSPAIELEIDDDGKLTGRYVGEIVDGQRKAELLKLIAQVEKVNLAQTIAVGDGANDLPMLGEAGLGIAFHAKPRVVANAKQSINTIGIDGVLYFLGFKDSYLGEQGKF